jgi:hypothetical protein
MFENYVECADGEFDLAVDEFLARSIRAGLDAGGVPYSAYPGPERFDMGDAVEVGGVAATAAIGVGLARLYLSGRG